MQRLIHHRWAVPIVSGIAVAISFIADRVVDWPTIADVAMLTAAVVAGTPIVIKAARALAARIVGIDLLVSIAAIGAIVIGELWEAAAVTFLFAIGHALESATLNRTRSALAELVAVAPDVAIVVRDGEQLEVPAGEVEPGETVLVKDGGKVPVDGAVIAGSGAIDEASITGESIPVEKVVDDPVYAGTIAKGGFLQVRATGVGADTTLARIIHRVEEAQEARARTQRFMDRFSAWYTPGIMALAVFVGIATGDVVLALTLLVIACPGALVISIPVSIVAGIGRAAKDGILIKGGEFLETSARISAVALDKTGTLTTGRPEVDAVVPVDGHVDRREVLRWAALAEGGSDHPLARPIRDAATAEGLDVATLPEDTVPVPGKGIVATIGGRRVLVGNLALLVDHGVDPGDASRHARSFADAGRTPMVVALDDTALGVIAVADQVRPDAAQMVEDLHRAGVGKVVVLTGDVEEVARSVAAAAGIDEVRAGLLPEDKLAEVVALQRAGHTVAMVGDGVNDAPALATADIGIAMGAAGSAVAVETADIALMSDDLVRLPEAVSLARRTVRNMRQNITVALATVAVLLAGVLVGGVTMSVGMLVHEASVLIVIANAMRLLRSPRRPTRAGLTSTSLEVVASCAARGTNPTSPPTRDPRGATGAMTSTDPNTAAWQVFLHFQVRDQATQRAFIEAYQPVVDEHVAGWPGFLGATLYASTDGTRVINHTRWADEAAYLHYLDASDGDARLRAIQAAFDRVPEVSGPDMTVTHTYEPVVDIPGTEPHVAAEAGSH